MSTVLLLAAGVAVAVRWFGGHVDAFYRLGPVGPIGLAVLAATTALMATWPPAVAVLAAGVGRLSAAVDRRPGRAATLAAVVAFAYLTAVAGSPYRVLRPYVHDEFSYLIQARQLARGHGWYPAHPLGAAFDSFQLFGGPVYASAYFPGTALLYVPGVWLGLPPFVTSLVIAAVVAGLLFHVTRVLVDPLAAVVAVLLLLTVDAYRSTSTMVLAQLPTLLYGLTATAAYLAWRRAGRPWAAAVIGAAAGLLAVTRPVDAVAFVGPIGVAMVLDRWRRPAALGRAVATATAAAVPFLGLQLALNHGITGHWWTTPFRLYADRDYPGTAYGFHRFDPSAEPASTLPQKRSLYDEHYRPVIAGHTMAAAWDNLFVAHDNEGLTVPRLKFSLLHSVPAFSTLMPLAFAALATAGRRRWVVLAVMPAFVGLYVGYVFFFSHYGLAVAPAVIVAVLVGTGAVADVLPSPWAARAYPAGLAAVAVVAVLGLPQLRPGGDADLLFSPDLIVDVDHQVAEINGPAVVLFRYAAGRDLNQEPVYNADVAWPDDATVVRAHDLGPAANRRLFAYYAARPPARTAYLYDEGTRKLTTLGPVADLATRE